MNSPGKIDWDRYEQELRDGRQDQSPFKAMVWVVIFFACTYFWIIVGSLFSHFIGKVF